MMLLGAAKNAQIGPEIFGLRGTQQETLDFAVPPSSTFPLKAIRVVFRHNPAEASHSTRAAIQSLTFVPKIL